MTDQSLNRAVRAMLLSTTIRDHDTQQWPALRTHLSTELRHLAFEDHELDVVSLLFLTVDAAATAEFVATSSRNRPLAAAYHLLALGSYGRGSKIEGTPYTLDDFKDLDSERIKRLDPYRGIGLRQKIAAVAGGYGRARGVLSLNSVALQSVADAVIAELRRVGDTHHREGIRGAFSAMRDRVSLEALKAPRASVPDRVRRQWLDCKIRQTVMEVDLPAKKYVLRTQIEFRRRASDIVIVQLSDEAAAVWLCSRFPEVLDSFTTTDAGLRSLTVQHRERDRWIDAVFEDDLSLTAEIYEAGRERWPQLQVRALRARVDYSTEQQIDLTCDFELDISDGYFYWMAGCEVEVKSIHADISILTKHVDTEFFVVPKMLPVDPIVRVNRAASWAEIRVDSFVPPGASVEVHWDGPR